ncbi:hypothetical protein IYX23_01365 [Methylocystis sp. L43]|jgi:hypothetical protein|uniref:hypothetical protein n=1 Tax=unclassified Methylocystis TaxID=2625913 RepID=UPI0018C20E02|nr:MULTISPECIES: hypothetical protein [unclassified Methylocystis]MBG0796344.1 hypothetical protein [Methylocystis sp. L43]MBG0804341.1 hypothetical protein [Methylocystis sp. H15]
MENWKQRVTDAFWFALAVLFLIETWLWDHFRDWLHDLGRALGLEGYEQQFKDFVATLTPLKTLAIFITPAFAIVPAKLVGFELIAHGHVFTGLFAILLAKTLALGVMSFLFDICRDKLMQIDRFRQIYSLVLAIRAWAARLVAPFKQRLRQTADAICGRIEALIGVEAGSLTRRLARMRELARQKRSA